jgi:hypothetical protein
MSRMSGPSDETAAEEEEEEEEGDAPASRGRFALEAIAAPRRPVSRASLLAARG